MSRAGVVSKAVFDLLAAMWAMLPEGVSSEPFITMWASVKKKIDYNGGKEQTHRRNTCRR